MALMTRIAEHLRAVGLSPADTTQESCSVQLGGRGSGVALRLAGPSRVPQGHDETALQAALGLMHQHGLREETGPRRIGVDYATTIAAVTATHGVLAALLAGARGRPQPQVTVSATAAVLRSVGHYLALTDAEQDVGRNPAWAGQPPPLRTGDGRWMEVETFNPVNWGAFWSRLGVDGRSVGHGWRVHCARQWTAQPWLPQSMHDAVAARKLDELDQIAQECGIAVVPLEELGRYPARTRPWTTSDAPTTVNLADEAVPNGEGPLSGLTVVEATRWLQGPFAGRTLALLGAKVIWIEMPEGDPARGIEPVVGDTHAGFCTLHHGKEAIRLDVTSPSGRRALVELIAQADVFLHNWPQGRAERLQLSAEDLWRIRPSLIYAHADGWAPHAGPAMPRVASDWSAQTHSGLAVSLRSAGEQPAASGVTVLDILGGHISAEAVLAALLHRQITGQARAVYTSLLAGAQLLLPHRAAPSPVFHPLPTADGYLAVHSATSTRRALRLSPDADRQAVIHALSRHPAHYWAKELPAAGAVCTLVRSPADIIADPVHAPHLTREHALLVRAPWSFA
ncbi:CoA transferase [Streptomyces cellulosae]